jgi:hypothetical protein
LQASHRPEVEAPEFYHPSSFSFLGEQHPSRLACPWSRFAADERALQNDNKTCRENGIRKLKHTCFIIFLLLFQGLKFSFEREHMIPPRILVARRLVIVGQRKLGLEVEEITCVAAS